MRTPEIRKKSAAVLLAVALGGCANALEQPSDPTPSATQETIVIEPGCNASGIIGAFALKIPGEQPATELSDLVGDVTAGSEITLTYTTENNGFSALITSSGGNTREYHVSGLDLLP